MTLFSDKVVLLGVISIIVIAIASYGLFFLIQYDNEKSIRESIFEQELERQIKSTNSISQHISSDLRYITSVLQDLADSVYLQNENLSGDKVDKIVDEKFRQLKSVTEVDGLLITDKDGIINVHKTSKGLKNFVNIDLSSRDYMKQTKSSLQPVYSNGFTGIDGKYRIAITYPIVSVIDGHYIGTAIANLPTIDYFKTYGNVENIKSQFLVAFDKLGNLLAVGASKDLVGKNFFGNVTQAFIDHNQVLNNLTHSMLAGNDGYALYNYGKGERLNTESPILVGTRPVYFLQVVTPTDRIYTTINSVLLNEGIKMFSLLTGTTAAIIVLVILLRKWYGMLQNEVRKRTRELNESNEKLMIANESLKKKDEAQNQFINIAAHELRTPIQPILNAIYLLQSANVKSEKRVQYFDIIRRNTDKLGRLAEDILDVTRIESDTFKLTIERINLYDLISNAVEEYRKNIQLVYTDLVINYESAVQNISVNGDKLRLGQVLFILLDNAGKFTKSGSILVTSQIKSNTVQVVVKDDGPGIDPEILPQLFTKFVTKSDRGTGLGLFIAKNIIETHGGIIWAENSVQHQGAVFLFTLPLANNIDEDKNGNENDKLQ
ncbi:MAG TPA: ATP-binding protein [Nitrososphaeraceae archaeon]|jgi:signal transduction histidine kinase|nr:ATP-binding protein [Nitrososphaeraceae archaeon]